MRTKRWFTSIAAILLTAILALSVTSGCTQAGSRDRTQQGAAAMQQTISAQQAVSAQQQTAAAGENAAKQREMTPAKKGNDKQQETTAAGEEEVSDIREDEEYYSKDDVAEYLYLYEHLPDNYITKNEAKKLGWNSSKGNLWDVAPGKVIGGDTFGNREGLLPKAKNRKYYECDVNYDGGYRGDDRIIYSNDGLIYFTDDHYNSFELLYGEED